jgi:hypothetical protein
LGKSRQFPLAKNWSYHKNLYFPINPKNMFHCVQTFSGA